MAVEAGGAGAAEVAEAEADLVEATEGVSKETGKAGEAATTSYSARGYYPHLLVVTRHI